MPISIKGARGTAIPWPYVRKAVASGYALEQTTFKVRLIRVPLPGGKSEILVTSLLDATAYPACEFGALYHQRWRIEECLKLLKCRLAVEHFSGELPDSVRQDFLAKVTVKANSPMPTPFLLDQSRGK